MANETITNASVKSPNRRYHGTYQHDATNLDDPEIRAQNDPYLKKPDPTDPDAPLEGENLNQEEITYKKRYGDLRRHQQNIEKEKNDRIKELEIQLRASSQKELVLPKTDEEVEEWRKSFPDVYDLIKTISAKEVATERESVADRLAQVEEMRRENIRDRAENKIRTKHADFDELKNDPDFHEWAKVQPKSIQSALYENDDDADAVIRAIDLYKFDTRPATPQKKPANEARDAAQVVSRNRTAAPTDRSDDGRIYESDVKNMNRKQFEKAEAQIEDAMRNGKFVYDVSGGAR